ncbi:hypothetical protein JCM19233_6118 [Vibrio astriarenae]|nr:hypothetical protein JCM19233_6118 [Vibrio sp. C7]
MVYSTIQFLAVVFLAVICSQAMMFSQGELPALVVLIPALWLVSQLRSTGVVFVVTMLIYGLTLSHQRSTLCWVMDASSIVDGGIFSSQHVMGDRHYGINYPNATGGYHLNPISWSLGRHSSRYCRSNSVCNIDIMVFAPLETLQVS